VKFIIEQSKEELTPVAGLALVSTIIKLYHDHGTSEQFHSELKTDLDLENQSPCARS